MGEKSVALVIWPSWAELLEVNLECKAKKKKHVFNKPYKFLIA